MTHARQQIREAVATILSAQPFAWRKVIKSRIASRQQDVFPYLMVFAETEQSDQQVVNDPGEYARDVTIVTAGMLKLPGTGDTYTIEDKMDSVAEEIETKLTQSALRDIVPIESLTLTSTAMDVVIEDDAADHAQVTLSWRISYSTQEGFPDLII